MEILIDTDLLIDLERGRGQLRAADLLKNGSCAMSVITVSELLHGALRANDANQMRRQAFVDYILGEVQPLPISEPIARTHARLWTELVGCGEIIDTHDIWIAATALVHGLTLATNNRSDFQRIVGLEIL